jgi:hypothetical protein
MTAAVGVGGVITPAQYAGGGGGGGAVSSVFGRAGAVVATAGDYTYAQVGADQSGAAAAAQAAAEAFTAAGFAPLNNAALTGTPTAPTAAPGDTSTQLATDAFVAAAVTAGGVTAGAGLTKTGNTLSLTTPVPVTLGGTGQATDAAPPWEASDSGFLAWNFDPAICNSTAIPSAGYVWLARINLRVAVSITNVILFQNNAGATLTLNECYAGLFSSAGTLLGATADQSSNWATGNGVLKTMALTGGPYSAGPGFVWVGFVWNGTTGPTMSRWAETSGQQNIGMTAATCRAAANGSGSATSLASFTPSSNALNASMYFAAVS